MGTNFVIFCIFWRCVWLWDYVREFCAILIAVYREIKVSAVIYTKAVAGVKGWMQQVGTETQAHGFISQETVIFKCQASHVKYWNHMLVCAGSGSTPKKFGRLPWSYEYAVAQFVEALRYKSEDNGFDSRWCHWNFFIDIILPCTMVRGVDSASNRNEYQEYFQVVKAAGA